MEIELIKGVFSVDSYVNKEGTRIESVRGWWEFPHGVEENRQQGRFYYFIFKRQLKGLVGK